MSSGFGLSAELMKMDVSAGDLWAPGEQIFWAILAAIHVPGLRGNPSRSYPRAEIDTRFPGVFEPYVASLIEHWADSDEDRLTGLISHLRHIGIARYVKSARIDDTRVELQVARLPAGEQFGNTDLVNIVDVGFGVSQALPVLTASLNWFTRDLRTGLTTATKAELDEDGAFGEWPADFDDVALRAEREYLDAVEARHHS